MCLLQWELSCVFLYSGQTEDVSDLSAVQVRHLLLAAFSRVPGCEVLMTRSSTGGNAGMAAAYSARQLGVPATIVVPSVTPNQTVERLKDEGANVIIHGKVGELMHCGFSQP